MFAHLRSSIFNTVLIYKLQQRLYKTLDAALWNGNMLMFLIL